MKDLKYLFAFTIPLTVFLSIYFKDIFREFCKEYNYNWDNVELLGILQYFNICTLYGSFKDGKYGNFLFLYGKYLLTKHLNKA